MKSAIVMVLVVLISGCSTPPQSEVQTEDLEGLIWPGPPHQARIKYIQNISGPEDLGIRPPAFRRFMDALAGKNETFMVRPYSVAATEDTMVIGDPGLNALHYFDLGRSEYQLIDRAGEDVIGSPVGVAIADDRIFVSDSSFGRVFILDGKGEKVGSIDSLERPTGLAFDKLSQRLFVADTLMHRICVFDRNGSRLFEFGQRGIESGEFNFPSHIFVSDGRLIVNDNMNFRIQAFDLEGNFLSTFGTHGDGSGHFSQPKGVAADSQGHVYVAGATIDRVQIFSPDGDFMLAFGSEGTRLGHFQMPAGVTIHENRIYVADSLNSRVQVFEYVPE